MAGSLIGATCWWLLGSPMFTAPVGTQAYGNEEQAFIIMAIAALTGGTWIGTHLERRHLQLLAVKGEVLAATASYVDEIAARAAAADAAVAGQPWADEAIERRAEARRRLPQTETVFDGLNPYFCLSFDSLEHFGFTSRDELASVRELVKTREFPNRWRNPAMLHDLEVLDSAEDALVRVGLWHRHTMSATPPPT